MSGNYYNENDPFAAEWLLNLIAAGEIPAGDVDTRSIKDVQPDDLDGYTQCHFFAGIGGWSLALRLAGWPDDVPVWTGSCPCQPFSAAGKGLGTDDHRHLWPDFCRLIAARKPATTLGEQTESKDGREWLVGVRSDLEGMGYEFGALDFCAAGVAAPHKRQRLYWVADTGGAECRWWAQPRWQHWRALHAANRCGTGRVADAAGLRSAEHEQDAGERKAGTEDHPANGRGVSGLADAMQRPGEQPNGHAVERRRSHNAEQAGVGCDDAGRLVNGQQQRLEGHAGNGGDGGESGRLDADQDGPVAQAGAWSAFHAVACRDNRARRVPLVESGVQPLAHGIPRSVGRVLAGVAGVGPAAKIARRNRVGRLKGYGNAIVPQVAAEFIRAYMECG